MARSSCFGPFELKSGDSDKKQIFGGHRRPNAASYVTALQEALRAVDIPLAIVDGQFGPGTEQALKMFQWCLTAHPYRRFNQSLVTDTCKVTQALSGRLDTQTASELNRWIAQGYVSTGDLIRLDSKQLDHVEVGDGFRVLSHVSVCEGDVVLSAAAADLLSTANKKAGERCVKLVLNQAFRVNGVPVSGAVVTPATRSQHLIGHAIDCNIVDGSNWNNSRTFAAGRQTEGATNFINDMKNAGYRWGGNFSNPDTPHFDKRLNPYGDAYEFKFFFNQRTIANNHPIPLKNLN
ncbi:M15 family metallopeptidase [Marinobacter sp.]|uniref:M15 family metallopeptidase n=1 Tax=Marinobacter sp. TaxID=50741 RepID=UPI003A8F7027